MGRGVGRGVASGGSALGAGQVDAERRALRVAQHGDPGPPGTSVAAISTSAPRPLARATVLSTSATEKYGSQCGGTCGGKRSSITSMPPKSSPRRPHWVYCSDGLTDQPKTAG